MYVDTGGYRDIERRFLAYLKQNYDGKHIGIVAHRAPLLALDVLLKGRTWTQAIAEDWRKTQSWQPGWEYVLSDGESSAAKIF